MYDVTASLILYLVWNCRTVILNVYYVTVSLLLVTHIVLMCSTKSQLFREILQFIYLYDNLRNVKCQVNKNPHNDVSTK